MTALRDPTTRFLTWHLSWRIISAINSDDEAACQHRQHVCTPRLYYVPLSSLLPASTAIIIPVIIAVAHRQRVMFFPLLRRVPLPLLSNAVAMRVKFHTASLRHAGNISDQHERLQLVHGSRTVTMARTRPQPLQQLATLGVLMCSTLQFHRHLALGFSSSKVCQRHLWHRYVISTSIDASDTCSP